MSHPTHPNRFNAARMRHRLKSRALASALTLATVLTLAGPPQAAAQMVVFDPANVYQSVLQAARALEQVNNQLRQIENEVKMLQRLDLQLAPEVGDAIRSARELFGQAQAVRYNLGSIASEIRALYPEDFAAQGFDQLLGQSDRWVAESRGSVERLMEQQARAASGLTRTERQIARALVASGGAEGQTSAIQAGNQMLGVLTAQLAEMQALQLAQSRALAAERLEQAAREQRASEIRRRAFPETRSGAAAASPPARTAF